VFDLTRRFRTPTSKLDYIVDGAESDRSFNVYTENRQFLDTDVLEEGTSKVWTTIFRFCSLSNT